MRRFGQVAGAVAGRSIRTFLTNPALLLPSLIFPLFFFTAFAGGLSNVGNVPGFDFPSGYTAFQFVFVLLQAAAFGGVFTGFGIAADRATRYASATSPATSTPLPPTSIPVASATANSRAPTRVARVSATRT
jgi:ABC-2 type transport system permease protein